MEAVLRADAEQSGGAAQANKAEAERRLEERMRGVRPE
jgi:hypothetical protein